MRKVALAITASLVLAVVAPAFSQPFADVPTDHWAFDAIAELAAKGIVEGYPDGTFKGDRAMTRYEMAMVVARLLARIEAIKIPAPAPPAKVPPPEVSRADITTLQRLINEFRAELAALGVRVTAVEEELAALRDRLDNVRVTGDTRLRYNIFPSGSPSGTIPNISWRQRLTFTGRATPNVSAVARLHVGANTFLWGSAPPGQGAFVQLASFDLAYLDLKSVFGVDWRIGTQEYTLSGIGASGYGLLFDPVNTSATNFTIFNGVKGALNLAGFGVEFGVWRESTQMDIWTGRIQTGVIPGWTLGFSGISQRRNASPAPVGAPSPTTPSTSDTGLSVDVTGNLLPGLGLGAAFATFNPTGSPSSSAWTAWLDFNLGQFTGMTTFAPKLQVWYKSYGKSGDCDPAILGVQACVRPMYTSAGTEFFVDYLWDLRGWGTQLTLTFSPVLSGSVLYEAGNVQSSGATYNEWFANVNYTGLAPRTTLSVNYRRSVLAATDTRNQYRIQLSYSF